ncbi:MAG: hypothetical protein SGI92_13840 [Bryobacteraceae bacterium]|nr:hypothetical protein [Bryobacteraceae bacterium]
MGQVQQHILVAAAGLALWLTALPQQAQAKKFYDDDPLLREPKPKPVGDIRRRKASEIYDYFQNTLGKPGEKIVPSKPVRAKDISTTDEVPDNAWYVNRHGKRRMSIEELVRGAGYAPTPSMNGRWEVTSAKTEGVTPGFTVKDSTGRRYQLKFDVAQAHELGTGADVMGSKFYWAFGYWVPQNFIVYFPLEQLVVGKGTKFIDQRGQERDLRQEDIDDIMKQVPRDSQNRFRAVASAYLEGQPVGPWKYNGVRADDPNDIWPHEHLRALRALRVFNSWVQHTDAKSLNGLDTVVTAGGVKHVRHHLIDFSAAFGAEAFEPKSPRAGFVYLLDWKDSARSFFTFGLAAPAWVRADYDYVDQAGRLESKVFDPEEWKPNYYSPAMVNLLPDDAFWAAKTIMKFTEPEVRAIVATSEYSSKEGQDYLVRVLMERQRKIGQTWFSKVLPLDNIRVENGRLAFDDLGAVYKYWADRSYTVAWSDFDNETERRTPIPGASTGTAVPRSQSRYVAAEISSGNPQMTVTVYLRRRGEEMQVVGVERTWPTDSIISMKR